MVKIKVSHALHLVTLSRFEKPPQILSKHTKLTFSIHILGAGNRYKMQQLQQKDWCEQQISVKKSQKDLEKKVNQLFDQQTLEFNKILKQTQEEHNKTRTQNEVDTDNINKILAQEKKEKEVKMHETWAQLEKHELEFTNNHDFMTENP